MTVIDINNENFRDFLSTLSIYGDLVKDIYPEKEFNDYYTFALENNLFEKKAKPIKEKDTKLIGNIQNINFEWLRYFLIYNKIGNIHNTCNKAFISEETLRKIISNTKKYFNSNNLDDKILFHLKKLYNAVFDAEEFFSKINKNDNEIKIAFVGNTFLLIDYVNEFFSTNTGIKISIKGFFDYDSSIKSLENNEVDIGILNFLPDSDKIEVLKKYIDDVYILKYKNNSEHFISVKDYKESDILEKYNRISNIQDTETRLIFSLNTNSDTLALNSSINYYKSSIDEYLFDNFDIKLYNGTSREIVIVKNKNKILNEPEKIFIQGLSEKLNYYNVREKL